MPTFHRPGLPPFSLAAVVGSHGWVQLAPFARADDGPSFCYLLRLATGRVTEIQVDDAAQGVLLTVEDGLAPAEQAEVEMAVDWMLGLPEDLAPFYAATRHEPKLAQVEPRGQGRVLRCATVFEDAVKTILTTNTSWAGTKRMVSRLVDLYGDPWPGDTARHAFPTPAALAALDEAALRSDARLGFRAPSVLALAQRVATGELDLEALKRADLPTPELRKLLMGIRGVGGYAAANLLMLLGRYDFLPIDSWAMKMVSQEWHAGQPIGQAEVEAAFAAWGEWKGLAYFFWDWANPS